MNLLFNIFINDIFYFIRESSLYNYADDNTLSYEGHNLDQLITVLERDSLTLIEEFLQKLVKDKKIHEARAFNFTYRYIDDVVSINNSRFAEFLPLIYPPEVEVKEITYTASSASFLDLYLDLTTVVNSVLKFMINGTTSILKS